MAVIEYDEYKQKLQALEPTLGELESASAYPARAWAGPPAWETRSWAYSVSFCTPYCFSFI